MTKVEKIAEVFSCIAAGGLMMLAAAIGVGRLFPSTVPVMETVLLCSPLVIALAGLGIVGAYAVDSVVKIKNHGVRHWLRGFVPNPPQTLREKAQWLSGGAIVAGMMLALASLSAVRSYPMAIATRRMMSTGVGLIVAGVAVGIMTCLVNVALEVTETAQQEARSVRYWVRVIKIWLRGLRKNR